MGRSVLIVDDAPEVRALAELLLRASQWTVFSAGDGETALEIARREKPDVVLTDVRMPGLDGIAVLQGVQAIDPDWRPACAFLTASPEDLDRSLLSRMRIPVISKPFRASTFAMQVAVLLDSPASQ